MVWFLNPNILIKESIKLVKKIKDHLKFLQSKVLQDVLVFNQIFQEDLLQLQLMQMVGRIIHQEFLIIVELQSIMQYF
jgi:hypothetical protein